MSKKKLLLAGGGHADIPLIQAAQGLGYHVITTGNRPEELGHKVSDEYRGADYSSKEEMLALAKDLEIDFICPCCNDFSAISSAYVAEQLGLPGHDSYDTSKLIHHKDSYRAFALANDIPSPLAKGFNDVDSALEAVSGFTFPLIVKPVDLTGGKGINKVQDPTELSHAVEAAFAISKSRRIVIEEFVEGTRHGFSAFVRDGKVVFHFSDNEHYYLNQYMVSAASTPSKVPDSVIQELVEQAEKIVQLMKLGTGIFHVQFILRVSEPVIIEICRRPPGDLYIKLVEHATGVDYPMWIVKAFCGHDCSDLRQVKVDGFYLRHCIMAESNGFLDAINIDPSVEKNIIDSMLWWQQGDRVEDYLVEKFGIVFMKFKSVAELLDKSEKMQQLIHADVR